MKNSDAKVGTGNFNRSGGFFALVESKNVIPGTNLNEPQLGIRTGGEDDVKIAPIVYCMESDDSTGGFHPCYLFGRVLNGTHPELLNDFIHYMNFELYRNTDGSNQDNLAEFWVSQNWTRIVPHNGDEFLKREDGSYPQQPSLRSLVKAMIPNGYAEDEDEEYPIYRVKVPSPQRCDEY